MSKKITEPWSPRLFYPSDFYRYELQIELKMILKKIVGTNFKYYYYKEHPMRLSNHPMILKGCPKASSGPQIYIF